MKKYIYTVMLVLMGITATQAQRMLPKQKGLEVRNGIIGLSCTTVRLATFLSTILKLIKSIWKAIEQNVFLLDQFTIADDKVLLIEIFEKNGGRHQTLQVENSDLIKASLIKDIHLKF